MKKILTIFASALLFAACSNDKDLDTKTDVVLTDTTGMYKSNYSTDVAEPVADEQETKAAPTKIIRETRVVYVDRTPKQKTPVYHEATPAETVANVPQTQTTTPTTGTTTSDNSGTGTNSTGTGTTQQEPEKKEKEGWSNATKGAVLGGVGGGVVGAVISKKKVKGAVIGGILGAAGGYILGKKKDNKQAESEAQYTSY